MNGLFSYIPCHGHNVRRDAHRLKRAILIPFPNVGQSVCEGLIPQVHAVLFDGDIVNLCIGDRSSELTVGHAQVESEAKRICFAGVVQALTSPCDKHVS